MDRKAPIKSIYDIEDGVYATPETKEALERLEHNKRKLMEEKEAT
jgi:prefoldin subunit 5